MASSTTQLERIAGLVDKLGPIATKQRGDRIEAQEWNTLVEVLLGVLQLDRLQEQRTENLLDQRFATKDHEHLGQVSLTWLDADLQARLGGGDNSIATRQLLAEMDQKIRSLSDQVSKLSNALENSQRVLDDTIVSNTDKTKKLLDFERRFKGIEDLRTTVTTLSNDVGAVRVNVDKVLELRKSLQDEAGTPINVFQLKQDLTNLQSIRENLKGADGKLLRLRDIEVQIKEVADVVGTGGTGGLEGRFNTFSASLQDSFNERTEDRITEVQTALRAETSAIETRLHGEIQASATQTRDVLTQQTTAQISSATTTFNSTLDTRLNDLTENVSRDALNDTRALLNQRLAEVPDQIRTQLDTAVTALRGTLTTNLQSSLNATLAAQVKGINTRLDQQLGAVQTSTTALTESIPGIVTAQLNDALPGLQTTLNQQITTQVGKARSAIEGGLDTRVSVAVSNSLQNLDTRISTAVTEQAAIADRNIATAVSAATRNIPAQVADEVKLQIEGANFDGKIQDSAKTVTTQLRSELKSALADQDVRTSGTIQSSVRLLQGQVAAATAAATAAANEFTTAQTRNLRVELTNLVDTRTRATHDAVLSEVNTNLQTTRDAITVDLRRQVDTQIRSVNDNFSTRIKTLETRARVP
ncbi:MAG: hypothetical protein V7641_2805 [Blastocatellia bacterium]